MEVEHAPRTASATTPPNNLFRSSRPRTAATVRVNHPPASSIRFSCSRFKKRDGEGWGSFPVTRNRGRVTLASRTFRIPAFMFRSPVRVRLTAGTWEPSTAPARVCASHPKPLRPWVNTMGYLTSALRCRRKPFPARSSPAANRDRPDSESGALGSAASLSIAHRATCSFQPSSMSGATRVQRPASHLAQPFGGSHLQVGRRLFHGGQHSGGASAPVTSSEPHRTGPGYGFGFASAHRSSVWGSLPSSGG